MRPHRLLVPSCLLGLMIPAGVLAQTSTLVVPPALASQEGADGGMMAGFSSRFRQQMLVSSTVLQSAQGKTLLALWFRRDDLQNKPLLASTAQLNVDLSHAARPLQAPSPVFAQNHGPDRQTVFTGNIALPASGSPPSPVPFDTTYAVRIPLNGFVYNRGDLCLEIDGTPVNPPPRFLWWVDYDHEDNFGSVQSVGAACGLPAAAIQRTLSANAAQLVPGSTLTLTSFGWPLTPGILIVGPLLSLPVALGTTGCTIYVQPQVPLGGLYPPSALTSFGAWHQDLQLPSNPTLLGARFQAQAANFEPGCQSNALCLTTTNALDLTLASKMPSPVLSIVRSDELGPSEPWPATGRVTVSRGPVMQFEVQ